MPNDPLSDAAIEAFFTGVADPGWEHDEALATLADDMALVMANPAPVADHALRQLFWETPAVADAPRTAPEAWNAVTHGNSRPVGGFRGRLRVIAGAALGTALALSGVGVAGATGVLPAPAQRVVASVVEAVSPFELPYPGDHPRAPSGGGAVTPDQDTGGQAPPAGQQPGVSIPGPSSDQPQTTLPTPGASAGLPTGPGSAGLDQAGRTPAGQQAPPLIPGPGAPSDLSPGASGNAPGADLDRAGQTPAATVPATVAGPAAPGAASNNAR
ncbi:MAG: hypothetical protein LC713_05410 [Actinobacteria bacterium]|nr:hypothetical protein [Actinomycetota bacterium]